MYNENHAKVPFAPPNNTVEDPEADLTTAPADPSASSSVAGETDAGGNPERRPHVSNYDYAFCAVKSSTVDDLGTETQRGRLRYDAAAVGRMLMLDQLFAERTDAIEYAEGFSIEQQRGEFVASLKSVARSLYARCFFHAAALTTGRHAPDADAPRYPDNTLVTSSDVPSFDAFYRSLAMDVKRRLTKRIANGVEVQTLTAHDLEFSEDGELLFACLSDAGGLFVDPCLEDYLHTVDGQLADAAYLWDFGHAATKDDLREWETKQTKNRAFFGKRLSVRDTANALTLQAAPEEDAPQLMVQCSYAPETESFDMGGSVRVACLLTAKTARRYGLHRAFTKVSTWHGPGTAWRTADAFPWMQRQQQRSVAKKVRKSTGKRGSAKHHSIGAFRPEEINSENMMVKENLSCTMPYVVLDIDAETAQLSKDYANALLNRLAELGADLSSVVVSYTGGRGFHIRIPAGMLGNPVYRTTKDAARITGRWAQLVFGNVLDGAALEAVDAAKFSPNTLIRAIGSVHERTGRYCVGYSGAEFLETILWKIQGHADVYSPFTLSDPLEAPTCPHLAAALTLAAKDEEERRTALRASRGEQENRGIIASIEQGVGKGEEFAPGYVGRNYAALLLSVNYIQRFGEDAAWNSLLDWNDALPMPLGEDPEDDPNELAFVFGRAKEYASV